jgi:predicted HD phosphohydrolase
MPQIPAHTTDFCRLHESQKVDGFLKSVAFGYTIMLGVRVILNLLRTHVQTNRHTRNAMRFFPEIHHSCSLFSYRWQLFLGVNPIQNSKFKFKFKILNCKIQDYKIATINEKSYLPYRNKMHLIHNRRRRISSGIWH